MTSPGIGRVLVLAGCSSSGKTSIARALQTLLPQAHLHIQLDAFRAMEPAGYWHALDDATARQRIEALCRAMHASVVAYARHGQNVILDTVLDRASAARWLDDDLGPLGYRLIGVHCALDELERREAARGDREIGLARRQYGSVHARRPADFVVDTTSASPARCAGAIGRWLDRLATIGA